MRIIPPVALVIPLWIIFRSMGLIDTRFGLSLAYLSFSLPFTIWVLRGFMSDILVNLEEAALIDGCSRLGVFIRIVLPLIAPGIAAVTILNFLLCWKEFFFALILTSTKAKTVSPAIAGFITEKAILWGRLYAATVLVIIIPLLFYFFAQKHLIRNFAVSAGK